MKKRVVKTTGLTWLEHSLTAFNGSGYADMSSGEAFLESYIDYKTWKHKYEAVELAKQFYEPALALTTHLVETSEGASHEPSEKNMNKFNKSRNQERLI